MYCEECQVEYPDDRKFCPEHGTRLTPVPTVPVNGLASCPACGKNLQSEKKFCTYCGYEIAPAPKPCPRCNVLPSPEAKFCGDCGYNLTASEEKTEIISRNSSPRLVEQKPVDTSAQTVGRMDSFFAWLRTPAVRVSIEVSSLLVVVLFAYQLGSRSQTPVAHLPSAPAESSPPSPPPVSPPAEEKQSQPIVAKPPESPPPPVTEEPTNPEFTEEPLDPPRRYAVTTETVMRDKPSWSGKKIADLNTDTDIDVEAILKSKKETGDWLKVQSQSTPPKPPGYVFADDAKAKQ